MEPSAPSSCLAVLATWDISTGPEVVTQGPTLAFLFFTDATLEMPLQWSELLFSHFKNY